MTVFKVFLYYLRQYSRDPDPCLLLTEVDAMFTFIPRKWKQEPNTPFRSSILSNGSSSFNNPKPKPTFQLPTQEEADQIYYTTTTSKKETLWNSQSFGT